MILNYSLYYITLIYTVDMLRVWSPLSTTIDFIGQSITVHAKFILHVLFQTTTFILTLHPPSFTVKLLMPFYQFQLVNVQMPCHNMYEEYFNTQRHFDNI